VKKLAVILLCAWSLTDGFSQKKEMYSGPYQWDENTHGQAQYEFIKDKSGKQVLHGNFYFLYLQRDSVDQAAIVKTEIKGAYKNGKKEGKWSYLKADHHVVVKDVVNYEIVADLQSEVIRTEAQYLDDLPHGKWEMERKKLDKSQFYPLLRTQHLEFFKGQLTGRLAVEIEDEKGRTSITGMLDKSGWMDSLWEIRYPTAEGMMVEKRHYRGGILLHLAKVDGKGKKLVEVEYVESKRKLNALASGEKVAFSLSKDPFGVRFNDGYRRSDAEFVEQLTGNQLLEDFLGDLLQFDRKLYFINGTPIRYAMSTRRFEYPVSKEAEKSAIEVVAVYQKLKERVVEQAESNALALNKTRTDSLAFAYEYFRVMLKKLDKFDNIVRLFREDRLKNMDESIYTRHGLEYLAPFDTIRYRYNEEQQMKVIDHREVIETGAQLANSILGYLKYEEKIVRQLQSYIDRELQQLEIDSNISALEARVMDKKEQLEEQLASAKPVAEAHERILTHAREFFLGQHFDKMSGDYTLATTYPDKMKRAEQMLDMLQEVEKRLPDFLQVFNERDEIDELYYENVFNAFTYSSYEQRAKERLYKSGMEKLLNHYLENLATEKDYTKLKNHLAKINKLFDTMRKLREQDTRRIERKLRNNDSTQQIESVLEL
jgi:hypothetical protein